MADIKQAARWLRKDQAVRRKSWHPNSTIYTNVDGETILAGRDGRQLCLWISDLLANDWELAE